MLANSRVTQVRSALLNLGYRVSISHAHANAIKTNAPVHVLWDIMRAFVAEHPVKYINPQSPAAPILAKAISTPNISFERHPDAVQQSKQMGISRFPENPTANWGPKSRAGKRYTVYLNLV
jgi:tRNA (guanine26-N2/guanine27-N2)-dimethyltransferase